MTPLDHITRRQYLEEEMALAAATHQYVLDSPSPTSPAERADRDALLDRLRTRRTNTLDCLTRHTNPARDGGPEWQGPVKERARQAAWRFGGAADAGAARCRSRGRRLALAGRGRVCLPFEWSLRTLDPGSYRERKYERGGYPPSTLSPVAMSMPVMALAP